MESAVRIGLGPLNTGEIEILMNWGVGESGPSQKNAEFHAEFGGAVRF